MDRSNLNDLPPMVVLSLMSGTSADGIDAVLAYFEGKADGLHWEVLARKSEPYEPELRAGILDAMKPERSDVSLITQLHAQLGVAYANVAQAIAGDVVQMRPVELVALSGQTIYHIPRLDESREWRTVSTLQLGEASVVAQRCHLPVMSDFRQSDMAAGGQGAPLVAFGDLYLYGRAGVNRAVQNLGGISNLTYLSADGDGDKVFAFDTGPANCLMDEAAARYLGESHDRDGRLAAAGNVDSELLESWLAHPYLLLPPPKTTGREMFELSAFLPSDRAIREPADILATLCAFTAESIAAAYRDFVLPSGLDEILLAGGGALNPTLVKMLHERLPVPVRTFADLGYDARDREALAFGVMAYFGYHGRPNILPAATGARESIVAGKLVDQRPRIRR